MIYAPSATPLRCPTPISAADQVLIDRRIAKYGINHIPQGISGETIGQRTASSVKQFNNYCVGPNAWQAARRKAYVALADRGISRVEIAKMLGVNRQSVSKSLRRMGIKIRGEVPRNG